MFQNGESWKTTLETITSVEYMSSSRCGLVKGSVRFFHMSHHTLPCPSMVPFSPAPKCRAFGVNHSSTELPSAVETGYADTLHNRRVKEWLTGSAQSAQSKNL
jgi:hypothetical protein